MPDIAKVKRNVSKMVSMNAPESDIDEYIASEGATVDDVRNFKPQMFKTEEEGRQATAKAIGQQALLQRQAEHPFQTAIGKSVQEFPAFANKVINVATMNLPEIAANRLAGITLNPTEQQMRENPLATGTAEALGYVAPIGAPMKAIEAANIIKNPLTRAVAQGAGAMATQLPVGEETAREYATRVGIGGALGAAGRGVEKVAEGALQKTAGELSSRIGDYLVKLPTKAFRYSKDPMDVLNKEAPELVAGNLQEYTDKASKLLDTRSNQLEEAVAGSEARVDASKIVTNNIKSAASSLRGSFKDQSATRKELIRVTCSIRRKYGDLKDLSVLDAIKLKRQLAKDYPFTKETENDPIAIAAHKMYYELNGAVEAVEPSIAELNHRVSGLIDISKASQNRAAIEFRNNPFGLVGRIGAAGLAGAGALTGHGVEGLASGIAVLGFEKVINSPALLTRVAKALSMMSVDDKAKILLKYPKLKAKLSTIKVDPRDIEILPSETNKFEVKVKNKLQKLDLHDIIPQKTIGTSKKLGIPLKSAEGVYNSVRDPNAIRMGSSGLEKPVINLGGGQKKLEYKPKEILKEGQSIEGQGFSMTPYSTKQKTENYKNWIKENARKQAIKAGEIKPSESLTVKRAKERLKKKD